jgi:hypothetical protein
MANRRICIVGAGSDIAKPFLTQKDSSDFLLEVRRLRAHNPALNHEKSIAFIDMSDFDSVWTTVKTILEFEPSHVINFTGFRAATAEACSAGLEKHMVVNALSPFLLFSMIASRADTVHFVNFTTRSISRIDERFSKSWLFDFDNKQFAIPYARSKHVLEVSSTILSKRFPSHKFTIIDPGMVKSSMTTSRAFPLYFRLIANFFPTANRKYRALSQASLDWQSSSDSNLVKVKLFGTHLLKTQLIFDEAEMNDLALCLDSLQDQTKM